MRLDNTLKALGLIISLCLLAACQDRGAFKSATASIKQRKAYCAKPENQAACQKSGLLPADPTTPDTSSAAGQTSATDPVAPTSAMGASAPAAPVHATTPFDTAAEGKVFSEIKDADERDLAKKDDLSGLLRGLDISIAPSPLTITITADVMIANSIRYLFVTNAPVKYYPDGQADPTPLQYTLKDWQTTDEVATNQNIVVSAICKDQDCAQVYVRFDFKEKAKVAVFVLYKDAQYAMAQSQNNLTNELLSFAKAQELDPSGAAAKFKAAEDQLKAPPKAAPAAPAAAAAPAPAATTPAAAPAPATAAAPKQKPFDPGTPASPVVAQVNATAPAAKTTPPLPHQAPAAPNLTGGATPTTTTAAPAAAAFGPPTTTADASTPAPAAKPSLLTRIWNWL